MSLPLLYREILVRFEEHSFLSLPGAHMAGQENLTDPSMCDGFVYIHHPSCEELEAELEHEPKPDPESKSYQPYFLLNAAISANPGDHVDYDIDQIARTTITQAMDEAKLEDVYGTSAYGNEKKIALLRENKETRDPLSKMEQNIQSLKNKKSEHQH